MKELYIMKLPRWPWYVIGLYLILSGTIKEAFADASYEGTIKSINTSEVIKQRPDSQQYKAILYLLLLELPRILF